MSRVACCRVAAWAVHHQPSQTQQSAAGEDPAETLCGSGPRCGLRLLELALASKAACAVRRSRREHSCRQSWVRDPSVWRDFWRHIQDCSCARACSKSQARHPVLRGPDSPGQHCRRTGRRDIPSAALEGPFSAVQDGDPAMSMASVACRALPTHSFALYRFAVVAEDLSAPLDRRWTAL